MVTALSDLQRLLMLPRAASYSAWHGLCESSATFKFTCSSLPLEVWGLIKIDEQMGGGGEKKMMGTAATEPRFHLMANNESIINKMRL